MTKTFRSRLIAHSVACFVYLILAGAAFFFYRHFGGTVNSRGVAAGMASQLAFYCVAGSNILMIALPRVITRLIVAIITSSGIFLFLVPAHPIRAIVFTSLAFLVTISAIFASELGRKNAQINAP